MQPNTMMLPMPCLPDDYEALALSAERGALGLLMLGQPSSCLYDYEPSLFTGTAHHSIYRAIEAAAAKDGLVDIVTVSEELDRAGELTNAGGLAYIGQLAKNSPHMQPHQMAHVVRGYVLARYAMVDQRSTVKLPVRLRDAVANGWAHGRAWVATTDETRRLGLPDAPAGTGNDWVCYVFQRTGD